MYIFTGCSLHYLQQLRACPENCHLPEEWGPGNGWISFCRDLLPNVVLSFIPLIWQEISNIEFTEGLFVHFDRNLSMDSVCQGSWKLIRCWILMNLHVIHLFVLNHVITFDSVQSAQRAKASLNGADIYSGCCTLKIEYAKVQQHHYLMSTVTTNQLWFLKKKKMEDGRYTYGTDMYLDDVSCKECRYNNAGLVYISRYS